MKAKILIAIIVSSFVIRHSSLAQGALTPPGAPAPTMKSLSQIEPRTPISSVPFIITVSSSYYLTTNVTISAGDAITVSANNVTVDLNGFTISSTQNPASGTGILLNAVTNITIVNGFIRGGVTNNAGSYGGSGFYYGIYYTNAYPANARVSGVSVSGCLGFGIYLGDDNSVVEHCTASTVGGTGIYAQSVSDSTARICGQNCITAVTANNCYGYGSNFGDGVHASTASNCNGTSFYGHGISAFTANNCYGASASGNGVDVTTANNCYGTVSGSANGVYAITAVNCYGDASGTGGGVSASTAMNCYGYVSGNGTGISARIAHNCYGQTTGSGQGIYADGAAIGCFGVSVSGTGIFSTSVAFCSGYRPGGTAIQAYVANGCFAYSGTNNIANKYNMP